VPNLLLQPIVENAIRHGIVSRSEPGRIEISSSHEGELLRLQVKDNGPGLAPIESSGSRLREGLGLGNTRARLEQLYGPSHRFDMADAPEGGLQVTLDLPFHKGVAPLAQPEVALG
jgi:two-component system LytT family sensor kinase